MMSLPVWLPGPVSLRGVSVSGPMFLPPIQRPPPGQKPPWTETFIDRDPHGLRLPPGKRSQPGQRPPPPHTIKSARYASYCNAYLFWQKGSKMEILTNYLTDSTVLKRFPGMLFVLIFLWRLL